MNRHSSAFLITNQYLPRLLTELDLSLRGNNFCVIGNPFKDDEGLWNVLVVKVDPYIH